MQLTKIDRLEKIEDIIQQKIINTEKEIESLGEMKDPEICRMRIMYLMDLGSLREILISVRRKQTMEYEKKSIREDYHDQVKSFAKSCHVGRLNEENQRRCRIQRELPTSGRRRRIPHVGRDGGDLQADGQRRRE